MSIATKKAAIIMAALAAAAIGALLAWAFSRQSTVGLAIWSPAWRRNFILVGLLGLLPLGLLIASLPRLSDPAWKPGKILAILSFAFAGLGLAAAGGFFGYLGTATYAEEKPLGSIKLVDPKTGIRPEEPGVLRLSLSSDPHWGSSTSNAEARSAILRSVASASPRRDAFFILGDNVEMGMNDDYWRAEEADLRLLGTVPARPILGNHDGLIGGERHFKRYFFPAGMGSDSGSPFYYSIDAGPATLIVLNLLWGEESFNKAQAAWLEKTLSAQAPGKQVVVLSHCFFYASGYVAPETGMPWYDHKGTIGKVSPILEKHKVALVISGHNHYMEYLEHGGVAYAVVGAMGGILDPEPTYRSPASTWFKRGSFGRLDLDIDADGIALAFRDQDGAPLYETRIPKAR